MDEFLKRLPLLPPDKRARLLAQLPPLSFAQQRLWFIDQFEGSSAFYNMPAGVRLDGRLDALALARTFNEIVRRHEALRTSFVAFEGQPVQFINAARPLPLPLVDLSALPPAQKTAELERWRRHEAQRPFDLARAPLLRLALLRLSQVQHVALVTMHHIVADGWSIGVLVREVAALYEAYANGRESPLPELPIQYADYAAWQRERLQGDTLERELSYWRQQLGGELTSLELPTDRVRPALQSYRGGHVAFRISAAVTGALRELGRREGATLFMVALAAFQVLLQRYSGQPEIVVGTPVAGRERQETEGLIGFFVNTMVLRSDLSGDPTFAELLQRVRAVTLEGYAHQEAPFEKLVEELQPQRSLSHSPLFQVMMVLQNTPAETLRLTGLTLTALPPDHFAARFDLLLSLTEAEGGITGSLQYKQDLFDARTAEQMAAHFQTLLAGIAANPREPLSRLPLLSEREQKQQLEEWNATATEYSQHRCIHELFEEQVERTPDAVAVVEGHDEVTYRELNRRANQLAHYLRGMGVGAEQLVGLCLERSVEMVVATLAVLKAGGAYVPLNVAWPPERLQWMVEDAGLSVLVTQQRLVASWPPHRTKTIHLDTEWPQVARAQTNNPAAETGDDNAAYVSYKSSPADKTPGVVISHRSLRNRLLRTQNTYRLGINDRVLQKAPFGFDVATCEIFWPLLFGARLVMARPGDPLDASYPTRLITEQHITVLRALEDERNVAGAQTLVEELVAQIWSEVLGREVSGGDCDFFELGGNSLLGTRMISRVREVFGVEINLRSVFEHPTLRELAAVIEEEVIADVEKMSKEEVQRLLQKTVSSPCA